MHMGDNRINEDWICAKCGEKVSGKSIVCSKCGSIRNIKAERLGVNLGKDEIIEIPYTTNKGIDNAPNNVKIPFSEPYVIIVQNIIDQNMVIKIGNLFTDQCAVCGLPRQSKYMAYKTKIPNLLYIPAEKRILQSTTKVIVGGAIGVAGAAAGGLAGGASEMMGYNMMKSANTGQLQQYPGVEIIYKIPFCGDHYDLESHKANFSFTNIDARNLFSDMVIRFNNKKYAQAINDNLGRFTIVEQLEKKIDVQNSIEVEKIDSTKLPNKCFACGKNNPEETKEVIIKGEMHPQKILIPICREDNNRENNRKNIRKNYLIGMIGITAILSITLFIMVLNASLKEGKSLTPQDFLIPLLCLPLVGIIILFSLAREVANLFKLRGSIFKELVTITKDSSRNTYCIEIPNKEILRDILILNPEIIATSRME
jgi:hypothetical protein